MWVLAAPNPAIVEVYNTTYVENGRQRKEFSGDNCHQQ
jgi:hypothetical protein